MALQHFDPRVHATARDDDQSEAARERLDGRFPFYMDIQTAREFIGSKNIKAACQWLRDHGIVRRSNGTVCRRDLQRELDRKRRHRMHPNSLINLRHAPQSDASTASHPRETSGEVHGESRKESL
jgi:hypothetical protein